jgi:hypothetical protein
MSRSETTRTIAAPASRAPVSARWTFARIGLAWKLAVEVLRESTAMERQAWNSDRSPHNGW